MKELLTLKFNFIITYLHHISPLYLDANDKHCVCKFILNFNIVRIRTGCNDVCFFFYKMFVRTIILDAFDKLVESSLLV